MAKAKKTAVRFPFNGKSAAYGYEMQPNLTCVDCLNVMPFDPRAKRLRGGQRAGTAKVNAVALVAATTIQRLHVAIRPPVADVDATSLTYSDTFTYSNGALAGNGNWITLADWFFPGDDWTVSSNDLLCSIATIDGSWARQTAALVGWSQGSAYTLEVIFQFTTGASDKLKILFAGLHDDDSSGSYLVNVSVSETSSGVATFGVNGTATGANYAGVTVSRGANHTLQLVCDPVANTIVCKLDGVTIGTVVAAGVVSAVAQTLLINGSYFSAPGATPGSIFIRSVSLTGGGSPGVTGTPRQAKLIAVCDGSVFVGTNPASLSLATNGTHVMTSATGSRQFDICDLDGFAHIVDGVLHRKMDLATDTVSGFGATTGTAPDNIFICKTWRGRLILSDGINVFASRSGDQYDFDYGQTDALAAWALNTSTQAGRVGNKIKAIIPHGDDSLVIATDQELFLLDGDVTDGGSLICVTRGIGMRHKDAWCIAPDGTLYLLLSSGLYKLTPEPGSRPIPLTEFSIKASLQNVDGNNRVTLCWDKDRNGMMIFVTPIATATATHYWYDAGSAAQAGVEDADEGACFPQQLPNAHGPYHAIVYDGDGDSDRYMILGGRDGFMRKFSATANTDDGTTISSFVTIGPIRPGGVEQFGRCIDAEFYLGELASGESAGTVWNLDWTLKSDYDPYIASSSPKWITGGNFVLPGRQLHRRVRQLGGAFFLHLANSTASKYWTMEQVILQFEPAGRVR